MWIKHQKRIYIFAFVLCTAHTILSAGPKFNFNDGQSSLEINTVFQLWGAYTPDPSNVPNTDPRLDFYLRRGRLGIKGKAMPSLQYNTTLAFDNIDKDPFGSTTMGSSQDLTNGRLTVFDAYLSYEIDSNLAVITGGYFRPQSSREFTNGFGAVSSLDFSLVYNYYREHLTPRSSGRETGLNLGGQYKYLELGGLEYQIGFFDAIQEKAKLNANLRGHREWSPLYTGRIAICIGDMENSKYALKHSTQHFGKRTGLTIAGYGSIQGYTTTLFDTTVNTDKSLKLTYAGGFKKNATYGADFLGNWNGFSLSGEISFLERKVLGMTYTDSVWYLRASYAASLGDSIGAIEPVIAYSKFTGDHLSIQNPDGEETQIDFGVNYFPPTKGIRIALHYIYADGKAKSQFSRGADKLGNEDTKNSTIVSELMIQF